MAPEPRGDRSPAWIWREDRQAAPSQRFAAAGKPILCAHCKGQEFIPGAAQLNTAGLTFLGLDWANRSAHTLMCTECGRIEWYGSEPEPLE